MKIILTEAYIIFWSFFGLVLCIVGMYIDAHYIYAILAALFVIVIAYFSRSLYLYWKKINAEDKEIRQLFRDFDVIDF